MRATDQAVIGIGSDDDVQSVTAAELLLGQAVLLLAPHPDDESLACGELLAAAFHPSGPGAHVVCLTNGAASHPASRNTSPAELAMVRRRELDEAVMHLGGRETDVTWIGESDGALVPNDAIAKTVIGLAQTGTFGLLLAPSPLDPHCDHVAAAEIGRRAARSLPQLRLCFYPVWSRWLGSGVAPIPKGTRSVRLPAGRYRAQKTAAIAAHRSQHGLVISDDPLGFEMPPGFAAFFSNRDEVYFLPDQGDLT